MSDGYSEIRAQAVAEARRAGYLEEALRSIQRRLDGPADGKIRDVRAILSKTFQKAPGNA
jgi:hypothetical protein